ncbi:class I SAM-dependent methyltransferase [Crossiella sp. SN42]|uniref:class I SAM-dependent methyltransferase n=1 Tax=Crossiella sp. SN42 TaxID=2944808 RepID=UPI00207C2607|nr:class I SAM-dependent methyltransferase [Crossiella sp. SN42]MCO1574619.1 class I SAM-dependent methyltransferase [Crossiella sp. SN42]
MTTLACRVCPGVVAEFFDFGRQPLSDAFRWPAEESPEFFHHLAVGVCDRCELVQLMSDVPPELMFHQDYPYLSSGSAGMARHFTEFAERVLAGLSRRHDPLVVEIGCNDGVLLSAIARAGVRHVGVEPSGGVAERARAKGVSVRTQFFDEPTAREILATDGPADLVYAANTLCHIADLGSILRGVRELLAPDGVLVFEDPYFADIVERTSFDQIYDEHVFFFTVTSVRALVRPYGLELVEAERLPVHGGELRYTVARQGTRPVSPAITELLAGETAAGLTRERTLAEFGRRIRRNRTELLALLRELRSQGRTVAGYGATAKSATVLNYCGIGPELLSFVCDTSPTKQGRLTPGSHIPVRPPAEFAERGPDFALLLAWNHAEEILAKEQDFRRRGGRWIHYVPTVRVS